MKELVAADTVKWEAMKKMSQMVSQVPGFAYFKKPAEAMLVAMKAHDMGLSFTEALEQVYVIKGKTAIQGALMLKRIYEAGHEINFVETTDKISKIEAKRKGQEKFTTWQYTIEDAKKAGLLSKDNWQHYPTEMLIWRNVARMTRFMFSDVCGGSAHLPDELGLDEEQEVASFIAPEISRSDITDTFMTEATSEAKTLDDTPNAEAKDEAKV